MKGSVTQRLLWALAVAACACLGGCAADDSSGTGNATDVDDLPDQEITDFVLRETTHGRLDWVFRAATARIFEAKNEIVTDELTVDFYDENGVVSSVLTARKGTVDRRTNAMLAEGDVFVRSSEGRTLETQKLEYSPPLRKILTEDFVTIADGANVLTGYGLEADPDLSDGHFQIKRDVKATVRDLPEGIEEQ